MSIIDNHVTTLTDSKAVERNFDKWKILGEAVAFNGYVGQTYSDEINFMKNWIDQRLTWMDAQIGAF